ncbi:MAG: DNA methyltransferase, partial [Candidatus Bathyarchaeota archaeon]
AVKKGHNHNWKGSRKESTLWEIANLNAFGTNKEDERTAHSTQKPLECMARPIRNNSAKGEGVYDPFVGSGTTLIAAEQLERRCYAMELDPAYCDMVIERWIKYKKKHNLPFNIIKNGEKIEWQ